MNVPSATIESINAIPLLKTLGIVAEEIGDRYAVMRVTVDERHLNYYGGAHGGLIATLVDTVCFFPAPLLPAGLAVTTSSLNVNYLRAVQPGETLVARSEIVHLGRRTVMTYPLTWFLAYDRSRIPDLYKPEFLIWSFHS